MSGARIMLADNQTVVRSGVRQLLKGRRDCDVCFEVGTSERLLETVGQLRPDIVILGNQFPQEIGSLICEIRRSVPSVEILVLSTVESGDSVRRAVGAGARGYVLTSDSKSEFLRAMKSLMRGRPYFSCKITEYILTVVQTGTARHENGVALERHGLSPREREILQLLVNSESNRRIAAHLKISVRTVETHRARIMNKLGLHSVLELFRYAIANGIVDPRGS